MSDSGIIEAIKARAWSETRGARRPSWMDVEILLDRIAELERELASARSFIADGECTCMPHAQPGDGTMCPRCEWLAGT